jgi:hypothetical protein
MSTPTVGNDNAAPGIGADGPATSSRSSKRTRNMVMIGVLVGALGGGAAVAGVMASGDRAGTSLSNQDFMAQCTTAGYSDFICESLWQKVNNR